MKVVTILALLALLMSCGGEAEQAVNADAEIPADTAEPESPADPVDPETTIILPDPPVAEPIEETPVIAYATIEDYGRIADKEQLTAEFGQENLVDGESWYAEGTVRVEHTELTDPENGCAIKYIWEDDGITMGHLEVGYYLFDEDFSILGTQTVESDCGVYTGMPLQDLKEWNGADFSFYGFGWDYEGGIFQDESRFADAPVLVKLSFDLEMDIPEAYRGMYSDGVFSTADDIAQGAPVLVDRLTYYP